METTVAIESQTPGTCTHCGKVFSTCKLKNRHVKRVHGIAVESFRKNRIMCPLCGKDDELTTCEDLRKHIEKNHKVSIEKLTFEFCSIQGYEAWKNLEKIETRYVKNRINNYQDCKEIHYECNKSDLKGR